MTKVSIIVPIYNVEKYLRKCLDSLINQTLKDIEIILVNDGSTDNSYEIAKEYSKKYKNIKVFSHKNSGAGYTRNIGLQKASGKYIMFIDSDDYIDPDTCERLLDMALENDADIVCYDLKYIYPDGTSSIMEFGTNKRINQSEYILGPTSSANKFYRREFLNKVGFKFKNGIWGEDIALIPSLVIYTDKIYYLKDCFYYYVQRSNSVTNQEKYNKKTLDAVNAIHILKDIFIKNNIYDKYKYEIEYIYISNLLLTLPLKVYNYKEGALDIKKMSNYMKTNYPSWRNNKFYKKLSIKQKVYCNLFYYSKPKVVKNLYNLKHFIKNIIRR